MIGKLPALGSDEWKYMRDIVELIKRASECLENDFQQGYTTSTVVNVLYLESQILKMKAELEI